MPDGHDNIQVLMSDVKTLIGDVAALKAVNEVQLVEITGIKEGFEKFKCSCHARHGQLDDEIGKLETRQAKQEERHSFTWKMIVGVATVLGLFAFIYEAWIK